MRKVIVVTAVLILLPMLFAMARQVREGKQEQKRKQALKLPQSLGRSQYIFFTGKVKNASVKEIEKFLRDEILPVIANSNQILGLRTYTNVIGSDFKYVVLVELGPNVPLSYDTVFEMFSNGKTPQEAFAKINQFANFFESSSSSVVLYRPDLSISRDAAGFFQANIDSLRRH